NLLEHLQWRYATKKFDSTKKVSSNDIEKLKQVIQLSVSSYGLQLYKVLIVENPEIREQLKPVSWNQSQITDASHLVVFC
ncbi:nitroreductase family protein, partial [Flagellimonas flava]|uniref:nitroreductase family protein n=2 Tax=Flavobacteriaceae TaxID=49546 RepID=UPI003D66216A